MAPVAPLDIRPDIWQRLLALGSILSVLVVAVGLYVSNEAGRRQLDVALNSQLTDRFTKAVELLGESGQSGMDRRLGAIYALERLMRDSPVDQPAVIDVLAAFVRVHAPPVKRDTRSTKAETAAPVPAPDVAASLTVIGRRDPVHDHRATLTYEGIRNNASSGSGPDLSASHLPGAYLADADLTDADFRSTILRDADLSATKLQHARFRKADLTNTNLSFSKLWAVDLSQAVLHNADFTGADFWEVDLRGANLSAAGSLTDEQVRCSWVDEKTVLPPKIKRPVINAPELDESCPDEIVGGKKRRHK